MKAKSSKGIIFLILCVASAVLAAFGALVGLAFGNALMGAAIGGAIPVVWCVIAYCFIKALDILFRGQFG